MNFLTRLSSLKARPRGFRSSTSRSLVHAVFALLLLFLTLPVIKAQEPLPGEVIRIDSNLVSVPVIVSDRQNHYLPGLKADNFKLYDNTTEQKIAFFDAAEEPLNVALLLDTSRSTEGVLKEIKEAARNFLKELRPRDRALIMTFDFAVHRLSPLTSDRKILENAIKQAKVGEYFGTTLNDAIVEMIGKEFKPVTGRKAIILLTDGEDTGSQLTATELLQYAAEADAMIYSIYYESEPVFGFGNGRGRGRGGRGRGGIFGPRLPLNFAEEIAGPGQFPQGRRDPNQRPDPRERRGQRRERREERRQEAVEFLTKLSEETSGRFYESDVADLKQSFDFIAEELRYQYRLGFYPQVADGTIHTLKVRVDRPDVAVRSRRQYRTATPK